MDHLAEETKEKYEALKRLCYDIQTKKLLLQSLKQEIAEMEQSAIEELELFYGTNIGHFSSKDFKGFNNYMEKAILKNIMETIDMNNRT